MHNRLDRPTIRRTTRATATVIAAIAVAFAALTLAPGSIGCVRNVSNRSAEVKREAAAYYHDRGMIALAREDYADAVVNFTEAIRIDPAYAPAYWHRGRVYLAVESMRSIGESDIATARGLIPAGPEFPDYRRIDPEPIEPRYPEALASMLVAPPVPEDADEVAADIPVVSQPPADNADESNSALDVNNDAGATNDAGTNDAGTSDAGTSDGNTTNTGNSATENDAANDAASNDNGPATNNADSNDHSNDDSNSDSDSDANANNG